MRLRVANEWEAVPGSNEQDDSLATKKASESARARKFFLVRYD
jgi:hypothetical protein